MVNQHVMVVLQVTAEGDVMSKFILLMKMGGRIHKEERSEIINLIRTVRPHKNVCIKLMVVWAKYKI